MGTWPKLIHCLSPFHISLLPGTGSVSYGSGQRGGLPTLSHLQLSELGLEHPAPGAPAADWPPTHDGESHARILILLSKKPYLNVSAAQLRYSYGASAVLSAPQRAKFMLL